MCIRFAVCWLCHRTGTDYIWYRTTETVNVRRRCREFRKRNRYGKFSLDTRAMHRKSVYQYGCNATGRRCCALRPALRCRPIFSFRSIDNQMTSIYLVPSRCCNLSIQFPKQKNALCVCVNGDICWRCKTIRAIVGERVLCAVVCVFLMTL